MSTKLSEKAASVKASATSLMLLKVSEMQRANIPVLSLNVGEPESDTPEHIKAAGMEAIRENFTRYTPVNGIAPLRAEIARKMARENLVQYGEDEITVTVGAKQALAAALFALLDPGDEVIVPVPCYVSYPDMVRMAGGVPVFVPLLSDYQLDIAAIRQSVTERTKAVIICTPNNPTGAVYREDSLRALAALSLEKDFFIIADEVYEKIVYGENRHFSVACVSPQVRDNTVTVNAFSKTYSMTGWRLGYACARADVIRAMNRYISQTTTTASSVSQKAALAALTGPQECVDDMVHRLEQLRDYALLRLRAIPGVRFVEPGGAFYLFFDVSDCIGRKVGDRVISSDAELCDYLLEEYHVAAMPGSAYYQENHIRISYSLPMETLSRAMDKLEEGIGALMTGYAAPPEVRDWRADYERFAAALSARRERVAAPRVVYQGEPGAYSEMAARDFFGADVLAKGLAGFPDAFEAIRAGEADYAVLPIENSSTGAIRQVFDLLTQYECFIVGETTVRVEHNLMGIPGTRLEEIDTVYSHEQGLFQCEQFLSRYPWRRIPQEDTAGSARMVAALGDRRKAAICSARAAELYGLEILARNINTNANNTTRFVVVSPQMELPEGRDKICVAITTAHHSGSLHEILTIFARHGLNLVKLESRPVQGKNWEYMFFIDFTGDLTAAGMDNVMRELMRAAYDLRFFGNFKSNLQSASP